MFWCLIMKNERDICLVFEFNIKCNVYNEKVSLYSYPTFLSLISVWTMLSICKTKRRWPENTSMMPSYTRVRFIADKSVIIVLTNCRAPLRSLGNGYTNKTVLYGGNEVSGLRETFTRLPLSLRNGLVKIRDSYRRDSAS